MHCNSIDDFNFDYYKIVINQDEPKQKYFENKDTFNLIMKIVLGDKKIQLLNLGHKFQVVRSISKLMLMNEYVEVYFCPLNDKKYQIVI